MLRVKEGELDQLGVLFEKFHPKVYDYFLRMTRDASLSSDLVQSTFERVLKGKHTYKVEYPFVGWIFRIAKNVLMDQYRRNKIKTSDNLQDYQASYELDEAKLEKTDLERALDRIKPEFKEVLLLTRYEDLKYQEVAEIIGVSETGVKTRVHRAIKQLRQEYLKVTSL